ncbi:MAG: hypothetical protein HYV26_24900 [Candidatus Hydrogenedentes bacterium]|nr:hypothetical protein [Candidatus Hydrogenedentota bacterium]
MSTNQTQASTFNPRENRLLTILMGMLLLGFAWQIRGNGTSNPSTVITLFLLFLSVHYGPRQKFHLVIFALAVLLFALLRTGWGTFVAQSGIPGLYPGHIVPDQADITNNNVYDIVVHWWMGYFWLFIVGLAWAGFPSLIFGGYFFTTVKYTFKHLGIGIVVFLAGRYLAGFIAAQIIPFLAPQYYQDLYLTELSLRNYRSMYGNLSTAMAIIPVLLCIYFWMKDKAFVWRSVVVMSIFGIGLSLASVWQSIGRNHPEWDLPFWSLWEYFSGFIIGGLLFWFYSRFSEQELQKTDISPGLEALDKWNMAGQFLVYAAALYFFVLWGLQDSFGGSVSVTSRKLEVDPFVSGGTIHLAVLAVALPLYFFYLRGNIGTALYKRSFQEKSLIALLVLLPVNYLNFLASYIVTGTLSDLNLAGWLDTISFVVVEVYLIYLYRRRFVGI